MRRSRLPCKTWSNYTMTITSEEMLQGGRKKLSSIELFPNVDRRNLRTSKLALKCFDRSPCPSVPRLMPSHRRPIRKCPGIDLDELQILLKHILHLTRITFIRALDPLDQRPTNPMIVHSIVWRARAVPAAWAPSLLHGRR